VINIRLSSVYNFFVALNILRIKGREPHGYQFYISIKYPKHDSENFRDD